jgi:hypothetical protein
MRTTVTLDPDVVRLLKNEAHKRGSSFKVALNDAVRTAFAGKPGPAGKRKKFVVKTFNLGPAFVDLTHVNRLLDEMDAEDFLAETKRSEREMGRKKK